MMKRVLWIFAKNTKDGAAGALWRHMQGFPGYVTWRIASFASWCYSRGLSSSAVYFPHLAKNARYGAPGFVWHRGCGFAALFVMFCSASAQAVTLTSAVVVASVSSINLTGAEQLSVTCYYSDGSHTNCTTADSHGSVVTAWSTSNTAVLTVSGGVATGVGQGSSNAGATVTGGVVASPASISVTGYTTLTITSVSLATTGGASSIAVGTTNQLVVTCTYSDGTTTNCATTDIHGNGVTGFTSSAPTIATVNANGLVTPVTAGSTRLSVTVQ
jgi:hypothetical protein